MVLLHLIRVDGVDRASHVFWGKYLREWNQLKIATPSNIDHNLLVVGTLIGRLVILLRL